MANKKRNQQVVQAVGTVVWILEASSLSGGVRVILEYARGLLAKGWRQVFYSLNDRPQWFNVEKFEWVKFENYNEMLLELKKRPVTDKIVATWWRTAMVLAKVEHPNSYYLVQDEESNYYTATHFKQAVLDTYGLGFKMFTTSHWVETNLFGVDYIGIGFRPDNFHPRVKERRVMTIARKQALKGFSYLVEMSQRLTKELAMPLLITGLDTKVELGGMSATRVGLSDNQMAQEYGKSLYYMCNSIHEGFGLPVLEAMASGCVVVTTNCDGPEGNFCVHEQNCLVVSKDDPREMLAAFKRLDVDKGLRDKLAKAGIETAKQWTWPPVIERLHTYLLET